ncbi:type II toxin-antitoxin system HicA family toxin [Microbacteriaceae bacterium K1510]|nr:type II toxin-antitoxin system HicA family toxin [Microbacteriaceae bacterium K1510]
MADFYREIIDLLRANGFQLLRSGKGSHEIWFNPATRKSVTVPRSTKSRHTANEVLKQAGLKKTF